MTDGDAEADGAGEAGGDRLAATDDGPAEGSGVTAGGGTATGDAHPLDELVGRPAASTGVVAAAVALAATFLPWTDAAPLVPTVAGTSSTLAAAFAGLAAVAFLLRRHGVVARRVGAAAAGVASAGVLLVAMVRFFGPATGGGADPAVGAGLALAWVAGALALALAVADARAVTTTALAEMARRIAVGFGLMVGTFLVLALLAAPLQGVSFDPVTGIVVNVVLTDLTFAAVAVAFLVATGRGLAFVDVDRPDVRDLVYVGVGFVALFAVLVALRLVTLALELPTTSNNITDAALEGNPETLLVLAPLSLLLVAPAEELLSRNVIQKYLYGAFSPPAAVVLASAIFASAHLFSYGGDTVVGMAVSLLSIFLLSLVLGVVYVRTENIVVPVVVHGLFNAAQFLLLYVVIVYSEVEQPALVAVPW